MSPVSPSFQNFHTFQACRICQVSPVSKFALFAKLSEFPQFPMNIGKAELCVRVYETLGDHAPRGMLEGHARQAIGVPRKGREGAPKGPCHRGRRLLRGAAGRREEGGGVTPFKETVYT